MEKEPSFISTQVSAGDYYYLNLSPGKDVKAAIVCGGREQCAPDYQVDRDGFKFCSIEFVSAGKGILTLQEETYPLQPGAVFFYGPGIPHRIKTDPQAPLVKHFIDFTGQELKTLVERTRFFQRPLYATHPIKILSVFENLLQTGRTDSRHQKALCLLLLKQLILHIDDSSMPHQEVLSPAWQTYLRCRGLLEQNFRRLKNIEQAAAACRLDKAYLCRLFQRYASETPLQLLTRLKMNRAAELLSGRTMLIKQIAQESGYSDPYHFSRVFKRAYGIPPESFQQTVRRQM
ncbi:MAG TPA: AraC family transcriptional regulator [Pontiellaceae bacterium]|nr:AraC family transcriptional regulator [Pontiellaceae bacterium]HPR82244.1 AraC family transcriptional regulator [Pontiellaceae bacterium]